MADKSTKQLVDIADIAENIVLLKNGSLRAIIGVSAINFELRSDGEQVAILQNFQRFLNSIDFPLQIVMNSRKLDIDEYIKLVDSAISSLSSELLKIQAAEYSKFIKELSELSNIMSKKFYIVIPFYIFETPSKTGIINSIKSIFKPSSVVKQLTPEQLEKYKTQLNQRVELVFDGLIGLGLKTRLLGKEELMNLYYGLYNPGVKMEFKETDDQQLTTNN